MKNKFGFYLKLAVSGMYKSSKFYAPYIFTGILDVSMFYNIASLLINQSLPGGSTFKIMMALGTVIVGLFCAIFLFYTNSFLIKRRKTELGLYNILGMEKRHIVGLVSLEALISAVICCGLGMIVGILFSRFMFLLVRKYFVLTDGFHYEFSPVSILVTLVLFGAIFGAILLKNIVEVSKVKPIELLKASHHGEKEPKTKWLLAVLGLLTLGIGYYLSLTTETPIMAIERSFFAVALVIVGTYWVFIAFSIVVLKGLRKNKKYYYKAAHFASVSGMLHRMKQNAVGLGNICILSTMVMVMMSTTASLFIGSEDIIRMRYPTEYSYKFFGVSDDFDVQGVEQYLCQKAGEAGLEVENFTAHTYCGFTAVNHGNEINTDQYEMGDYMCVVTIIEEDQFEALTGKKAGNIAPGTIGVMESASRVRDTLIFMGEEFKITPIENTKLTGELSVIASDSFMLVTPDHETFNHLVDLRYAQDEENDLETWIDFDVSGTAAEKAALFDTGISESELCAAARNGEIRVVPSFREYEKETFFELSSGFLFLGSYLGILFLVATVLIIYYKQMIEGYEDKNKYEIMQKVGMDKDEVHKTIRSQVRLMFFLPLGAAICHTFGAFPMLNQCLRIFSLYNTGLYVITTAVTVLIYIVCYFVVYSITTKVYYRIVTSK